MLNITSHQRCKLKSQWDTASHLSEWLSSINQQTTSAGKGVEKGNPSALLVGMQTGAATVENSMEFPQQIKMELLYDPVIPLLGIYPKSPETPIQKNLYTPVS